MDSSSDESFAWTDASDDTTDNETMAKTNLSSHQSGEESESGKSYKEKLQQRLFSENGHEDISTGTDTSADGSPPRKRKLTEQQTEVDTTSPKKKRVKLEPESDVETCKKRKHKQGNPHDQYDESFLDAKVKNEQYFAVPTPVQSKKKRKSSISNCNGDIDESNLSSSQYISKELSTDISCVEETTDNNVDSIETKSKKKKHKKKSRKRSTSSEKHGNETTSGPEDKVEVEDTIIQERYNPPLAVLPSAPNSAQKSHTQNSQRDTDKETEINRNGSINSSMLHPKSVSLSAKRKSRMSERIQFEDEEDSDVQIQTKNSKTPIISSSSENYKTKLRSYIESSVNLRPFHLKLPSPFLTDDDNVWVVKIPKEVKPEAFQDKKWVLDSKCKIKLHGQTYEGHVGDTTSNMMILCTAENDAAVIKNVKINGCIRLHRRIPKPLVHEDNVIVNNQSNFIPLPDTKCRHPLFGLHYKKAMKLPSAVVERLQAASAPLSAAHKRSRRDRGKHESIDLETSRNTKMEHAVDSTGYDEHLTQSMITSKKKKKKRKLSNTGTEEESAPRPKRSKHDLESAEAWESEKAIEENLFSF